MNETNEMNETLTLTLIPSVEDKVLSLLKSGVYLIIRYKEVFIWIDSENVNDKIALGHLVMLNTFFHCFKIDLLVFSTTWISYNQLSVYNTSTFWNRYCLQHTQT
ncbi:unnamed protein product [Rhizophagus irregularis]|nr:unnamed protein product [Rhizophagus irregularis]CAB5375674.1 unnamed protein product [Rhizophagus irregularis]